MTPEEEAKYIARVTAAVAPIYRIKSALGLPDDEDTKELISELLPL